MDPLTMMLIGQGANIGSSLINNQANQQNWERQNQQNIQMWHMQNQYNHPAAQVQRMKQAKLNPAMMYGSGSSAGGAAGAVATASMPRNEMPQFDTQAGLSAIQGIADLKIKQQQLNNLKEQENQIIADTNLKKANELLSFASRFNREADTKNKQYDLYFKGRIEEIQLDALKERNRKLKQEIINLTDFNTRSWNKDARERIMTASHLGEASSRNSLRAAQKSNIINEGLFQKSELEQLQKGGLSKNSPWWLRLYAQTLMNLVEMK